MDMVLKQNMNTENTNVRSLNEGNDEGKKKSIFTVSTINKAEMIQLRPDPTE